MQTYSYHCHTNFSDGKYSPLEVVRHAKEIGFSEIGITDHLIVHKDFSHSLSLPYIRGGVNEHIYNSDFKSVLPKFKSHCEELRRISKQENFKVYIGFEVDYFTYNGWNEEFKEFISQLDYDYLISGNHMFFDENGENVFDLNDFKRIFGETADISRYIRNHYEAMYQAVNSGYFKFLAHIDYVRKLGENLCGENSYIPEKKKVIEALRQNNMGAEISTKGLRKIGDFYPCDWIISEIAKKNIPVIISDDAHALYEMGQDFLRAEAVIVQH